MLHREAAVEPDLPAFEYRPRPARLLEIWRPAGWVMKLYGINADPAPEGHALVEPAILEAAKDTARTALAAAEEPGHRIGTVIVHRGRLATWLLVDWWARDVLMHHRLFRWGPDDTSFTPQEGSLAACTWELAVLAFERDAWVECILKSNSPGRLEAYLGRQFRAEF